MGLRRWVSSWPVYRQLTGPDTLGRGRAAESPRSASLAPRTSTADRAVDSVCPYCAVGCAQLVYAPDEQVIQIEGNPDSPDFPRPAVPQGLGQRAAGHRTAAGPAGALPAAVRHAVAANSTWTRPWT